MGLRNMIDDTPEVKWSGAWWTKWGVGIAGAVLCAGLAIYGLVSGRSWTLAGKGFTIWFVPVSDLPAMLMSAGYLGLALVAFGHGFCRYSERLWRVGEILTPVGWLIAAAGVIGCNVLPVLGLG